VNRKILLAFLIAFAVGSVSAEPSFSIKDSCETGDELNLFSMNDKKGGNIGDPGYFQHQVCVTEVSSTEIRSSCRSDESSIISMFERNDSHASVFDDYRYDVCVDGLEVSLNKTCEKPIVSLHSKTDSHVAEPGHFKYQLCATRDIPKTVTLSIKTDSDEVYVDGKISDKESYGPGELAHPYISTGNALGIVSYGPLESIDHKSSSLDTLSVRQQKAGSFLVPLTRNTYTEIDDDREPVNDRSFLEQTEASFGFPPVERPTLRVGGSPDYRIEGFEDRLSGDINLYVRNLYGNRTVKIAPR